jgi:hypothetical protein
MEAAGPRFEYLMCPRCGTRYLARQASATAPAAKARWFDCKRCNKRVKSADIPSPEPLGEPS